MSVDYFTMLGTVSNNKSLFTGLSFHSRVGGKGGYGRYAFTILGIEPSLGLLVSLIWGGAIAISALLSGAIWFFGK